jgi:hypothetical protein
LTAAAQLALATTMCAEHTQHCEDGCPMPAVERPTGRCERGRELATAWLGAWRRHVDAMSGRQT